MNNQKEITHLQWKEIEFQMTQIFVSVSFLYKGYEIGVVRDIYSENKTVLNVYINGEIKGEWVWAGTGKVEHPAVIPEIWKKKEFSPYSPKMIKEIIARVGKRKAKEFYPNLYDKKSYYLSYFSKASVLVRQFKKLKGLVLIK